jgi:hypothetical protein
MLSQLIARDIRRDVLVISAARIDEGILIGSVRTTNILYVARGLIAAPPFEPPRELRVADLWKWTGQPWGGLPDGTSIVDQVPRRGT